MSCTHYADEVQTELIRRYSTESNMSSQVGSDGEEIDKRDKNKLELKAEAKRLGITHKELKAKKKREKKSKKHSQRKKRKRNEDDDAMLAAVAAWAERDGGEGDDAPDDSTAAVTDNVKGIKNERRTGASNQQNASNKTTIDTEDQWLTPESITYSVHITQLPYEADVREVRLVFEKAGCVVTSIRFCYGQRDARNGGERPFKGVAFCDFADKASLDKALDLDKTMFPGSSRRMNVRPTKTKEELATIVEKREKMLEDKNYKADRSEKWKSVEKRKRRHIEARKHNPGGKKKQKRRKNKSRSAMTKSTYGKISTNKKS